VDAALPRIGMTAT